MVTFSSDSGMPGHASSWAVIAALRRELNDLRKLTLENLVFLETGFGTDNASQKLTQFLEKQSVDAVLGVGMAGALSPSLGVGDLFIVERAMGPTSIAVSSHLSSL